MPDDMRQWLLGNHLAWRVIEVTGEIDLSAFRAACRPDGQGQAPVAGRAGTS
ncbi:MAG: hypothetical protein ABSB59_14905 [Streptosporangiaceae bacterium]|jgi:hypothetical protein